MEDILKYSVTKFGVSLYILVVPSSGHISRYIFAYATGLPAALDFLTGEVHNRVQLYTLP